jgi:hypothetical protein
MGGATKELVMTIKEITENLPEGWKIAVYEKDEYDCGFSKFNRSPVEFSLFKDDVYIACGYNGMSHAYDWKISYYSIQDAKPFVDKIMDDYRLSLKFEKEIIEEKEILKLEVANKEQRDKTEKDVRKVLGLPNVKKPVKIQKSFIRNIFGWS